VKICRSVPTVQFVCTPVGYLTISSRFRECDLPYGDDSAQSEKMQELLGVLAEHFVLKTAASFRAVIREQGGSKAKYLIFGLDLHDTVSPDGKDAIVEFVAMVDLQNEEPIYWCGKTHILKNAQQLVDADVSRKICQSKFGPVGLLVCNDVVAFGGRSQSTRSALGSRNTLADKMVQQFAQANLQFVFNLAHRQDSNKGSLLCAATGLRDTAKLSSRVPIIQTFATSATEPELRKLRQNTGGAFCLEWLVD
jgi:hypothetical protein